MLPVRFFSADAANLHLISLIAPARGRRHMSSHHCARRLACRDHEVQNSMPVIRQVTEEERRRYRREPHRPSDREGDTDE